MATAGFGRDPDTTLGGSAGDFPLTTAGFLERVVDRFGPDHRQGWEELCRRYWRPIYLFIRRSWAKTNEDAKDLTQEFLAWLLREDVLNRYRVERASFRTFLKVVLRRFLVDQQRAAGRQKRGGRVQVLRLEDSDLPPEEFLEDAAPADLEKVFDQAWVVALVKHSVAVVRDRLLSRGQEVYYRVFEEYDLHESQGRPRSGEIGARLGLTDRQVRNILATVRLEVRNEMRVELARQTPDRERFEDEWKALLGI